MENELNKNDTFIYDGCEVRLTGRTAQKDMKRNRVDIIHEIQPFDKENGSWKQWVHSHELYKIMENE